MTNRACRCCAGKCGATFVRLRASSTASRAPGQKHADVYRSQTEKNAGENVRQSQEAIIVAQQAVRFKFKSREGGVRSRESHGQKQMKIVGMQPAGAAGQSFLQHHREPT